MKLKSKRSGRSSCPRLTGTSRCHLRGHRAAVRQLSANVWLFRVRAHVGAGRKLHH
jgi:hypothetical protein